MIRKFVYTTLLLVLTFTSSFSQKIVWKPKAKLPVVSFGGEAVACNNKIYCFDPGTKTSNGERIPYNYVLIYDIANDNWSTKPKVGLGGSHQSVNSIDSTIYFIGGGDNCNHTDIYNPETDTWTAGDTMPTGRVHIKGAVVDGKIYVMGGFKTDYSGILDVNEVYDPQTNTWEQKTPIPEPRENYKIAVLENKIYLFGGRTQKGDNFNYSLAVLAYTPATDSWEQVTTLPASRYLHAILTYDNKTVLASGYVNGSPSGRVDIYDYTKNTWVQANSLSARRVEMPVAEYNNSIYVIGGRNDGDINNLPMYDDVYEGVLITEGNFTPEVYIPLLDSSALVGTKFNYTMPPFTFIDDDTLTYSANLITGEALPEWLTINSKTGKFSGTPITSDTMNIKVIATDNYGAYVADTFLITINPTTSVGFMVEQRIELFPNPAKHIIHINKINGIGEIGQDYQLINLSGKIVKQGKFDSKTIDVSDLNKGIYFLQIRTDKALFSNKIVIE